MVPAPFCIAGYINDPKYVAGDKDLDAMVDGLVKKREANVQMKRSAGVGRTPTGITDYKFIKMEATADIEQGEELFAKYGNVYHWQSQLNVEDGTIVIE